eukprot:CAMPEP_0196796186 /NCGR_PEP_ID=MMETSP1104-20130614/37178_1 /TAXON_ID=33652 /ORGANISM="Cafeteria sp., Strain Caron Lab Isolate" /LENGTH=40 /DNA_ID= /DNA_START= /DNA_END= /DNA_ORIENTATION=
MGGDFLPSGVPLARLVPVGAEEEASEAVQVSYDGRSSTLT